jgi:hypothetical protein
MNYYQRLLVDAAQRVKALLELPNPVHEMDHGAEGFFDPWNLFPALYGSYSSEFDDMAIAVLMEIRDRKKERYDLGAEMFREMLCTAGLCEYGTSPRVCFATVEFEPLVPTLVDRWTQYRTSAWMKN